MRLRARRETPGTSVAQLQLAKTLKPSDKLGADVPVRNRRQHDLALPPSGLLQLANLVRDGARAAHGAHRPSARVGASKHSPTDVLPPQAHHLVRARARVEVEGDVAVVKRPGRFG